MDVAEHYAVYAPEHVLKVKVEFKLLPTRSNGPTYTPYAPFE
jgi:hypothetical protein